MASRLDYGKWLSGNSLLYCLPNKVRDARSAKGTQVHVLLTIMTRTRKYEQRSLAHTCYTNYTGYPFICDVPTYKELQCLLCIEWASAGLLE